MAPAMYIMCHALKEEKFAGEEAVNSQYFGNYLATYWHLLYSYWWNTRIFAFTKKSYLHCTQQRYCFYLPRVRILVLPWLLTYYDTMFRKWIKKKLSFMWEFHQYLLNKQNIHGRLGIQILSSCAESISHSWEVLSALEDKIRIPARGARLCNILYIYLPHLGRKTISFN